MTKIIKDTIHAKGIEIGIYTTDFENEFISLTDIARYRSADPRITIHTWLRGRDIVEFLGLWESLHNPDFKRSEFDTFKSEAGTNAFTFSIKEWNDTLQGKGIITKSGRYGGGIFAHSDIALEFASWLSPEFKLYIIKDYKRLKSDENSRLSLNWNLNRELSKLNYKIHTDAIKEKLIIPELTPAQKSFVYADEADLLNVALFGMTAKEWRKDNPGKKGNIRDYTDLHHLLVLANLESYNAILIEQNIGQPQRLEMLRETALKQLRTIQALDFSSSKILTISDKAEESK
ncbi:KilA-N domain-containing protein [uncultured Treponema sp.]|uniref:KilA-N domain-containing protein n=1 Tax=uncultured Treponema sp. TaxID=162155 RepID=UPI0025F748EE|nr:KilA-N domain-containing protein [uncultured Treponema sp.]